MKRENRKTYYPGSIYAVVFSQLDVKAANLQISLHPDCYDLISVSTTSAGNKHTNPKFGWFWEPQGENSSSQPCGGIDGSEKIDTLRISFSKCYSLPYGIDFGTFVCLRLFHRIRVLCASPHAALLDSARYRVAPTSRHLQWFDILCTVI